MRFARGDRVLSSMHSAVFGKDIDWDKPKTCTRCDLEVLVLNGNL